MIRFLFMFLVGYCIYLIFKGAGKKPVNSRPMEKPQGEITHKDPVCGVYVTEEDAVVGRLEGERIFFCSMECLEKYRESLEKKS
jgi:YHS domain-containing protein